MVRLRAKQRRIIELVAGAMTGREIAAEIHTTDNVVKNYLREIYDKTGTWNRLELALWWEAHKGEYAGPSAGPAKVQAACRSNCSVTVVSRS